MLTINIDHDYCLYTIHKDGALVHAGISRRRELLSMSDARRNSLFPVYVTGVITLTVVETHYDKGAAVIALREWLKVNPKPLLSSVGHRVSQSRTLITCNEDGKTYRNMVEAARVYGINQSTISNHLAKRPGYEAPGGHTFRRGQ